VAEKENFTMFSFVMKSVLDLEAEGKPVFYTSSDTDKCHYDEETLVRM